MCWLSLFRQYHQSLPLAPEGECLMHLGAR
ncbi:hypothetical protein LINPERPRIM_LOCUS21026 [Linum perenne]